MFADDVAFMTGRMKNLLLFAAVLAAGCGPGTAGIAAPPASTSPPTPVASAAPSAAPEASPAPAFGPVAQACAALPNANGVGGAPAAFVLQEGHAFGASGLAWSLDGRVVTSIDTRGRLLVWDGETGALRATLDSGSLLDKIAPGPDGVTLAAAGFRGVELWDLPSGRRKTTLELSDSSVTMLRWGAHGKTVGAVSSNGVFHGWSVEAAIPIIFVRIADDGKPTTLSPDGATLAREPYNPVGFWDARTGARLPLPEGMADTEFFLGYRPDGGAFATIAPEGEVRVWERASGRVVKSWKEEAPVRSAAWSPDGASLATVGQSGVLQVHDVASGAVRASLTLKAPESVGYPTAVFGPRGGAVGMVHGAAIAFRRLSDAKSTTGPHDEMGMPPAFRCDEARVAGMRDGALTLWEVASGAQVRTAPIGVALGERWEGTRVLAWRMDRPAVVWDAATGRKLATLQRTDAASRRADGSAEENLGFSPGGKYVLGQQTRQGDGEHVMFYQRFRLWDAASGALLTSMDVMNWTAGAAWSPDGTRLATLPGDMLPLTLPISIWNGGGPWKKGQPQRRIDGGTRHLEHFTWTPDGRALAVIGVEMRDGKATGARSLRLWDAATGELRYEVDVSNDYEGVTSRNPDRWENPCTRSVQWLKLSADGSTLATGKWDCGVQLRDAATGAKLSRLPPLARFEEPALHPRGTLVAVGASADSTDLYEVRSGAKRLSVKGTMPRFSKDGSELITSVGEGKIAIWDAATGAAKRTVRWEDRESTSDGTFLTASEPRRIHRLADGAELALRVLDGPGGQVFVAHTPEGVFDAADAALPYLRYRAAGDLRTAALISAKEMEKRYRRPGLVADFLAGRAVAPKAE